MPWEKHRWAGFKAQSSQVHQLHSCSCCLAVLFVSLKIQNSKFPKELSPNWKYNVFKVPSFQRSFFCRNACGDTYTAQLKKSCLVCTCKVEINVRHALLIHTLSPIYTHQDVTLIWIFFNHMGWDSKILHCSIQQKQILIASTSILESKKLIGLQ